MNTIEVSYEARGILDWLVVAGVLGAGIMAVVILLVLAVAILSSRRRP